MNDITIYPKSLSDNKDLPIKETRCFGIDLGTTSTLVCYVDSQSVDLENTLNLPIQFLKIKQESPIKHQSSMESEKVASLLGVHNGKPYVGNNLYHLKGHKDFKYKTNLFYHWKLELGIDHQPMYPNAISPKLNMPYKVAGGILNYIRKQRLGDEVMENTIITVPASFQANQRKDVIKAAEIAKVAIKENMLIDEPNAAFLGYFNRLTKEEKIEWANTVRNKNVLVVDFGGGTLDLSILNVDFKADTGIAISNRAISRYNDLGGQDLDTLIAEELLIPKLKEQLSEFDTLDSIDIRDIIIPQLSVIGEKLKIGLSEALSLKVVNHAIEDVDISNIAFTQNNCSIEFQNKEYKLGDITLTAEQFKTYFSKIFDGKNYSFKTIDKTVSTISSSINDILEKAEVPLNEVDYVLYIGGSSFNPFLHAKCREKLTNSISLTSYQPDKLVSEGAAVYSYFLHIHNISLIKPITSDTIGIIVKGNRFYPILEKGKTLPQNIVLPDFKFQSNLNKEVVVPVCINGEDYPIGEIRKKNTEFYDIDTTVTVKAEVTIDKVFRLQVFANNKLLGEAEFENPYSLNKMSKEEIEVHKFKEKIYHARAAKNYKLEKANMRSLLSKYYEIKEYRGMLETAEEYIKKFDDQDESVLNYLYISNGKLGRKKAAEEAIKKALKVNPNASYLVYNYSLDLAERNIEEALRFLENSSAEVLDDIDIKLRIISLKNRLGRNVKEEARNIVNAFKNKTTYFTEFSKENLLPEIFTIAGEAYANIDKINKQKSDDSKYIAPNNLPF